jgi:WD40 repeat protein
MQYPIVFVTVVSFLSFAIAGCDFSLAPDSFDPEPPPLYPSESEVTPSASPGAIVSSPLQGCQLPLKPAPSSRIAQSSRPFQRTQTWESANQTATSLTAIAFSNPGKFLVSSSQDLINYNPDAQQSEIRARQTGEILCTLPGITGKFPFSTDGKRLVTSYKQTIFLWDLVTGKVQQKIDTQGLHSSQPSFSPDNQSIVSPLNKNILIWNSQTGELKQTLEGHTQAVESLAFHPTQPWLISGSYDGTIKVWHRETGKLLKTLDAGSAIWSVTISPDGNWLASGHRDNAVRVWNLASGKLQKTLKGHDNYVRSVAISPDNQLLVSGGHGDIKIWNLSTGQLLQTLDNSPNINGRICTSEVFSLHFSADGQTLASSNCNSINLWQRS